MSKKQHNVYRALLENRRAELEQELAEALRDRDRLAAVSAPDVAEEAALTIEREFAITTVERLSKDLRQVKAALDRFQDGSYGTCLRCDRKISQTRLKAVPWAEYCVPCQEVVDEEARKSAEEAGNARSFAA